MINEHDLNDWHHLEPSKLYTVKPKTYIKFLDHVLWFDHLDGAFSYCTTLDHKVVHISASATVTPLEKPCAT